MSMGFEEILDDCIERILVKGETIDGCLMAYPGQAKELEPLLRIALASAKASQIEPRSEFKAEARYRFLSALSAKGRGREKRRSLGLRRWVVASIAVLVFLLAGGGTVAASSGAMPGDPLYSVKLATEQVRLFLATSDVARARLHAQFADTRVAEIVIMAGRGNSEAVEMLTERLTNHLEQIVNLVGGEEGAEIDVLVALLEGNAQRNQAALELALEEVPPQAIPALQHAMEMSRTGYERAIQAIEGHGGGNR